MISAAVLSISSRKPYLLNLRSTTLVALGSPYSGNTTFKHTMSFMYPKMVTDQHEHLTNSISKKSRS
jgi:hypothetical protein